VTKSAIDCPIRPAFAVVAALLAAFVTGSVLCAAQVKREFTVSARRYTYVIGKGTVQEIRVTQDDIVRVTFLAEDIPHSFTIDEYRINKRAVPGRAVPFEFRADKVGTFVFYCSLTNDSRCREETRGLLVVTPR